MTPDSVRDEFVAFVGMNPKAGEIIPESGEVRKVR